ncbi:MAG: hypothetical protein HUJ91_00590, partial [Bacteroidales bacterium]|nr:hypothetical protein [Bacteroidales bacterium]
MKLRTIVLSAALFIYSALGAEPIPFTPLIRNWSTADQGANRQNWSVAQDSEGIMYFANHSCLLEFDGHLWLRHPLPGRVNARSVAVAPDGRIYVGSYKQFGYFEKISDGSLEYHSVSDLLSPDALSEDDIWNIVFYNDKVLFQAFDRIFVYDGTAVSSIAAVPLNLFNIDGTLYSQIIDAGVNVISDNGEMTEIMPASCGLINSILKYDGNNLLMASANNGLYLYNRETRKYVPMQTYPKDALKGFNVNRG